MSRSERFLSAFFFLALLLLPFNGLPIKNVFGELSVEGAFYPAVIGLFLLFFFGLKGKRYYIPNHLSFIALALFIVWVGISGYFNLNHITEMFNKGRSGTEKFLLQYIVLFFFFLLSFYIFQLVKKDRVLILKVRKWILYSFVIAAFYSVLELLYWVNFPVISDVFLTIDKFIHINPGGYISRIRSVSGEASWFGMYCAFAFPWVLSYIFDNQFNRKKQILALLLFIVLLIILSKSRNAIVVITIQTTVFLLMLSFRGASIKPKKILVASLFFFVVLIIGVTAFYFYSVSIIEIFVSLMDKSNLSNIARLGSQYAAFMIGMDHPLFGVGLGQYGFYMSSYVPDWALVSYEIRNWMDTAADTNWPPVHSIYARILAELGVIGLCLWLLLWASLLYSVFKVYRKKAAQSHRVYIFGIVLITSILGVLLTGNNADSFRFFGYWILLPLGCGYTIHSPSGTGDDSK